MANPMIKLVNAETGEEIERPMTAAEFKQYEAEQTVYAAKIQAEESKASDKAALLARLGITADEAALLLS
jgi:hypothetical protein